MTETTFMTFANHCEECGLKLSSMWIDPYESTKKLNQAIKRYADMQTEYIHSVHKGHKTDIVVTIC